MAKPAELEKLTGLASRFGAFVAERHPFALADALEAFEKATGGRDPQRRSGDRGRSSGAAARAEEAAAGAAAAARAARHDAADDGGSRGWVRRSAELLDACDGFLRRAAIAASLTREERIEILRGMLLTRATDNRLKTFFTGGEVRFGATAFQGKGFRSLGQEAIYAAAMRLRRGVARYRGAPSGRMDRRRHRPDDPRSRRHARDASRAGHRAHGAERADGRRPVPPTRRQGPAHRRLRLGHPAAGRAADHRDADALPGWRWRSRATDRAASPSRSSAKADRRSANGTRRSTSAPRAGCRPIFCVQNNQTALSTPLTDQSAVRVFADKAAGLRRARHHHRRHRSRGDRRRVRLGGRARPRRSRADADRAGRDAHVRPRASRRHAVPRQGPADVVGLPAARRVGLREPRAVRVLGRARSDCALRGAAEAERHHRRRRSRSLQARGRSDRRGARRAR